MSTALTENVYATVEAGRAHAANLLALLTEEGVEFRCLPETREASSSPTGLVTRLEFIVERYAFASTISKLLAWADGRIGAKADFGFSNAGAITVAYSFQCDGEEDS